MDNKSCARDKLSRYTPQNGLFESELLSFLKEVKFGQQKFPTNTSISNIKYHHLGLQNKNTFYPFHDQLDYKLVYYLAKPKTTKRNIDKFLFEPLMALFTEKLSN